MWLQGRQGQGAERSVVLGGLEGYSAEPDYPTLPRPRMPSVSLSLARDRGSTTTEEGDPYFKYTASPPACDRYPLCTYRMGGGLLQGGNV